MNRLIILLLISFSTTLVAQDSIRPIKFGIGINYNYDLLYNYTLYQNYRGYRDFYNINTNSPYLISYFKNHSVFIGPVLNAYNENSLPRNNLIGFQIGYKIYPNKNAKVFNFFFDYNLTFIKVQYNFFSIEPLNDSTSIDIKVNQKYLSLYNFIGYGFDVKFLRHFSLSTSMGLGNGWNHVHSNPRWFGGDDGNYDFFKPKFFLKFNLEYHFFTLKK